MRIFAGRSAATLLVFAFNAMAAAGFVVRADDIIEASSSVLCMRFQDVDDGNDYDEAVRTLREQRKAATRLGALCQADSEGTRQVFSESASRLFPFELRLLGTFGMKVLV